MALLILGEKLVHVFTLQKGAHAMATSKVQQSGRQVKVVVSGEPQGAFDTNSLLAEVTVSQRLFEEILARIGRLRASPT